MPIHGQQSFLTSRCIRDAPAQPGVYALFVNGHVVFYGAALSPETIRDQLILRHRAAREHGNPRNYHFAFEATRFVRTRYSALLEEHLRERGCLPDGNQHGDHLPSLAAALPTRRLAVSRTGPSVRTLIGAAA
jgi:hypothetical protein